jgi:hypothetical protein
LGGGVIYISVDGGTNWTPTAGPNTNWSCVTSSADGGRLVAAVFGGGIYTLQTVSAPMLDFAPFGSQLLLSWTVPSANFSLEGNSNLGTTGWVAVTTIPSLSFTSLQNQVAVPAPATGSRYFRLKH